MAEALVYAAVEVPRRAIFVPGQGPVSPSAWSVNGENLLERALGVAMQVAEEENIRLLTTETDQGIFDLIGRYGVSESDVATWLERISQLARSAGPKDIVVIIRPDIVLQNYDSLARAIQVCHDEERVDRVEPAYKPRRYPLESIVATESKLRNPRSWPSAMGISPVDVREMGFPCPAFEVIKLRRFRRDQLANPTAMRTGFVKLEESEFVLLESSLDWLRLEQMLA